jgi:hypothetical protein
VTSGRRLIRKSSAESHCGANRLVPLVRGQMLEARRFFSSLHVAHIAEYYPEGIPYSVSPSGYRLIIDSSVAKEILV